MDKRRFPLAGIGKRHRLGLTLVSALLVCLPGSGPQRTLFAAQGTAARGPIFSDISHSSGLNFVHFNGMTGDLHFPEMTGQGGAFFDFDNDGDLDIYLIQGAMLDAKKSRKDAIFPPPETKPLSDRLYRNDLVRTKGGEILIRFTDISKEANFQATGYGMGVATGDFDNDGWIDLYVTNYGSNQLLRNRGDGTLQDVTAKAGVDDSRWSTSASFFDYDGDGWLDLYVTNYVAYSVEQPARCYATSSRRDYCGPSGFEPESDRLFRNRRDGTFEDVSLKTGIGKVKGAGLGVVTADFNADGRVDIYVANDGQANRLWLGQKDGTFQDDGLFAGVAVNRQGQAEASMGVDAADFDGDGDEDLFMTHLTGETNTLYVNDGTGLFEDRSVDSRLATASLPYTAFGTAWLDYDGDGWLDLVALNGAVKLQEALARKGDPYPLGQPNQLFHNLQGKAFEEVSAQAGPAFAEVEVSRGAAIGDIDNDGDTDLLVLNNSGPARLLRNEVGSRQPWLGLRLVGAQGRDSIGTQVQVRRKGAADLWRRVHTDGSYCSANDPRILLGLGGGVELLEILVHWPDGKVESFTPPALRQYSTLKAGQGRRPGTQSGTQGGTRAGAKP
jgi:hypothetical protein